jgi:hypothetical protein
LILIRGTHSSPSLPFLSKFAPLNVLWPGNQMTMLLELRVKGEEIGSENQLGLLIYKMR